MADCIFCKIAQGELPSAKIYEDDDLLAFMDINPIAPGHSLIIPKPHFETVFDMPDELLAGLITAAKRVALAVKQGMGADGINLLQSNGRAAMQIIDHYHLHFIPRWSGDKLKFAAWELRSGNMDEVGQNAAKIRSAL